MTTPARLFDLLPPYEQAEIRRHCQNVVALSLRRRYGEPTEHVAEAIEELPELAKPPRKFTQSQLEAGFANYPEPAERKESRWWRPSHEPAKPGPQAERKTNYKGERRTWTPGGKQKPPKAKPEPIDREPKQRPQIVRPLKPIKPPSLPERIRAMLLECGPMTNADLSEKLGFGTSADGVRRCEVATRQMKRRGEIEIVGTKPKHGSIPANLYKAVAEKPVKNGVKGSNLLRVAEWLKTDGPKTIEQMAEFLGTDAKFIRSITQRLIRYGMAHQRGRITNEETNRPLNLYVAGPEPIRSNRNSLSTKEPHK